jgi:hypothetical protein
MKLAPTAFLVAIGILCAAGPPPVGGFDAFVALAQPTRTLEAKHTVGRWQERVPVAGGIRVGVVVWQPGPFNPRELSLILPPRKPKPATPPQWLCVEISSRDGRYTAQLDYPIADEPAGQVKALVKAEDLDKLNTAAGEDVAVLASLSADCRSQTPSLYLVAAWRPAKAGERVAVLLNSRVPTTIVGGGATVPCVELTGVTTAYNLRCDLPEQMVKGEVPLGIRQKRGRGEVTVPLPLNVAR